MLAIAIVVVAMPGGARRCLDLEQCVDDFYRVANARVVGSAQAKTHQGQRVGTHQMTGKAGVLSGRNVLDVHSFWKRDTPSPVSFGAIRT